MAKAYWIATYRSIDDPEALAAYAKLAGPALQAAGGRFLARGVPAQVYESGPQPTNRADLRDRRAALEDIVRQWIKYV